ncbi:MAG: hypothetical protein N3A66_11395, partial [Planctomycetota bacterium]|nr:hypothetical protein [Planctomycetota bacterium]
YHERVGRSKLSVVRDGARYLQTITWTALNYNPVRASDGMGPRDFLLALNRWSRKRLVLDQGPLFSAAAGFVRALPSPRYAEKNRYFAAWLREHGGPRAFLPLPGDLAIQPDEQLLVVPMLTFPEPQDLYPEIRLPAEWAKIKILVDVVSGKRSRRRSGAFREVAPGVYQMQ